MAVPVSRAPARVADLPPEIRAKSEALAEQLWPESFIPSRAQIEKIGPPVNAALSAIAEREAAAGQQPEPGAA